ncbi:hypothetical protein VFPPC_18754 [Pochonia chlamydosporia 170]|uniref:Secreted protein n=1 Tax=Pochonia chlamydosporia 170 TaxID=1380566 RepID=A0A219ASE5_METCM|nr:hypothetical protein VFPPC_18754 [Pochonia chlamydosporia 170]OWT43519.1 hypothetical protein VFPPC_18754 [Pochonia chlamydosporia 170]
MADLSWITLLLCLPAARSWTYICWTVHSSRRELNTAGRSREKLHSDVSWWALFPNTGTAVPLSNSILPTEWQQTRLSWRLWITAWNSRSLCRH